jgi:hypothetical protein
LRWAAATEGGRVDSAAAAAVVGWGEEVVLVAMEEASEEEAKSRRAEQGRLGVGGKAVGPATATEAAQWVAGMAAVTEVLETAHRGWPPT